jgi:enoyl-CoA hydratase/carnithine racemase
MDVRHLRTKFDDYAQKYQTIRMRREDGILELTLHTEGGPLRWGRLPHAELEEAFHNIARDRDNQIVIMTGTGDEFSGPVPDPAENRASHKMDAVGWGELGWEAKGLLTNLLSIDAPMISAVNGPAARHAELPLMCDIVLAADTASFQDSAHFVGGLVPGDGMHVVMPMLMGLNRGRYFLFTGQVIGAVEAKAMGIVGEVLPASQLLPRAWELARIVLRQPELNRRYTRTLLTEQLRRQINELLPFGLALEGLAITQ